MVRMERSVVYSPEQEVLSFSFFSIHHTGWAQRYIGSTILNKSWQLKYKAAKMKHTCPSLSSKDSHTQLQVFTRGVVTLE